MPPELTRRPPRVEIRGTPGQVRKFAERFDAQMRAFERLSQFEQQAYPDLTASQVLTLRRVGQVSQRRPQSRRPAVRRRGCRGRSRSPGRLDDPDLDPLHVEADAWTAIGLESLGEGSA